MAAASSTREQSWCTLCGMLNGADIDVAMIKSVEELNELMNELWIGSSAADKLRARSHWISLHSPSPIASVSPTPSPSHSVSSPPSVTQAVTETKNAVTNRITATTHGESLIRLSDIDIIYPVDYSPPTLLQALKEANMIEAEEMEKVCVERAHKVPKELMMKYGLTIEDAASLALYTSDYGPGVDEKENFYRKQDIALNSRAVIPLMKLRGLLYLVIRAMRKLPHAAGVTTLFRGTTSKVNQPGDKVQYMT